jgi:arylformamidase
VNKIYDISLPLSAHTKVFPGDAPMRFYYEKNIKSGDELNLSEFSATSHLGTHIDAPFHYIENGQKIGELDLQIFIGICQLIKLNHDISTPVMPSELIDYNTLPPRVLFCTNNENKYDQWTDNFRALSVELIDYLYDKGIKLIGVDTPSVDAVSDNNALVHKRIFKYGMAIIENLHLNNIASGRYELIALPLKFTDLEASPCRAILREI